MPAVPCDERPSVVGIGLDESTALVVSPNGPWEIIGASQAVVYDAHGRTCSVQSVNDADELMLGTTYTYDQFDNLVAETSASDLDTSTASNFQATYGYDGLMRLVSMNRTDADGNFLQSITYTYDASSNVTQKVEVVAVTETPTTAPTATPTIGPSETPTDTVSPPVASRTAAFRRRPIVSGSPNRRSAPVMSIKASSRLKGSTSGENSPNTRMIAAEISWYRSKRGGTISAFGQRRRAVTIGMALPTP